MLVKSRIGITTLSLPPPRFGSAVSYTGKRQDRECVWLDCYDRLSRSLGTSVAQARTQEGGSSGSVVDYKPLACQLVQTVTKEVK